MTTARNYLTRYLRNSPLQKVGIVFRCLMATILTSLFVYSAQATTIDQLSLKDARELGEKIGTALQAVGVGENASWAEMKSAYRKLIMPLHPDRTLGDPIKQRQFIEITASYEILEKFRKALDGAELAKGVNEIKMRIRKLEIEAAGGTISMGTFRDPETGTLFETRAQLASSERLALESPDAMRARAKAHCGKHSLSGEFKEELFEEYVLEGLGWQALTGYMAQQSAGNDPAAMWHFFEQSLMDPVAHASLSAFILANHSALSFFRSMGWSFDPCNDEPLVVLANKRTPTSDPIELKRRARASRILRNKVLFSRFAPFFSLSFGLMSSQVLAKAFKDKDLMACARGMVAPVENKAIWQQQCQNSYDTWVSSRLIVEMLPDILGFGTSLATISAGQYIFSRPGIQTAGALAKQAVATGIEKAIPVVWRTVRFTWTFGSIFGPKQITAAVWLGKATFNLVIFMVPYAISSPIYKSYIMPWYNGQKVTNGLRSVRDEIERTRKNGWRWVPYTQQCVVEGQYPVGEGPSFGDIESVGNYKFEACDDTDITIDSILTDYGKRNTAWRKYVMEGSLSQQKNWLDYMVSFQNTYIASYNFYSWFVDQVAKQRRFSKLNEGEAQPLFLSDPTYGMYRTEITQDGKKKKGSDESAQLAITEAVQFLNQAIAGQAKGYKIRPDDLKKLKQIYGWILFAGDPKAYVARFQNGERKLNAQLELAPEAKRESVLLSMRFEALTRAIGILSEVLADDPFMKDSGTSFPSSSYDALATWNPFAKLRSILGDPKPLAPGIGAMYRFDENPKEINQDLKDNRPHLWNGAMLMPKMTDYLLTSMVCGPYANPSEDVKVQEYKNVTPSWFRRIWRSVSLWGMLTDSLLNPVRIADVHRFTENEKYKKSLLGPGKLTLVSERPSIAAEFHPPRIIEDLGRDVCNSKPDKGVPTNPYFNIHDGTWKIQGREYSGFLDIARTRIAPAVLGKDGTNTFDAWWTTHVDPTVLKAAEHFETQLKDVVREIIIPSYYDPQDVNYNGDSFKLGARASMLEEANTYFNFLEEIANSSDAADEKKQLAKAAIQHAREHLDLFSQIPGDSPTAARQFGKFLGIGEMIPMVPMTNSQHIAIRRKAQNALTDASTKEFEALLEAYTALLFTKTEEGGDDLADLLDEPPAETAAASQPDPKHADVRRQAVNSLVTLLKGIRAEVDKYIAIGQIAYVEKLHRAMEK